MTLALFLGRGANESPCRGLQFPLHALLQDADTLEVLGLPVNW